MRSTALVLITIAGTLVACAQPATEPPSAISATPETSASQAVEANLRGQIAYAAGVEHQVFLLDLESGERRQITELTDEHAELMGTGPLKPVLSCGFGVSSLAWSPGGTQLAFSHGGCETVLYLVDLEGNLTRIGDGGSPAWSPDGRLLVFRPNIPYCPGVGCAPPPHQGAWNLHVVDVGSGDPPVPMMVDDATSQAGSPTWSPDGALLAFSVWGRASQPELFNTTYVAEGDGSDPRAIGDGVWPTGWLPDGRLLVVEEQTGVAHALDLDTGDSTAIGGGLDGALSMSPDGTRYIDATSDPRTGAPVVRLTTIDGQVINERPGTTSTWAPDGSAVAVLDVDGSGGVVVLDREGLELRTYALPNAFNVWAMAWRPGD